MAFTYSQFILPTYIEGNNFKAKCKHCGDMIAASRKTSSNLLTHLKRKHPEVWALHSSASAQYKSDYLPYSHILTPDTPVKQEPSISEYNAMPTIGEKSYCPVNWQAKSSPSSLKSQDDSKCSEDENVTETMGATNVSPVIQGLFASHDKVAAIQPTSPLLSNAPFTMGTAPQVPQEQSLPNNDADRHASHFGGVINDDTEEVQRSHSGTNYLKAHTSLLNKKRFNPIAPPLTSAERKQYLLAQEEHTAKLRLIELQMDIATEEHHATMQLINKQTEMYDLRCKLLKAQLRQHQQTSPTSKGSAKSNGPCSMFDDEEL